VGRCKVSCTLTLPFGDPFVNDADGFMYSTIAASVGEELP
jgi:hypothetical protein